MATNQNRRKRNAFMSNSQIAKDLLIPKSSQESSQNNKNKNISSGIFEDLFDELDQIPIDLIQLAEMPSAVNWMNFSQHIIEYYNDSMPIDNFNLVDIFNISKMGNMSTWRSKK